MLRCLPGWRSHHARAAAGLRGQLASELSLAATVVSVSSSEVVESVVALPFAVAKLTSKAALPPLRVTVKVSIFEPLAPSVIETSLIDTEPATSSLTMVPTPWASAMVPPLVTPDRLTLKLSSASTLPSPLMVTEMVWVSTRASKCSEPALAT